jgi:hypothetical protein
MEEDFCGPSKTVSAREFLTSDAADIEVPEGREVSITAREHERHIFRVRLESFGDLQLMGLVPRGLREEAVRNAIRSDDERANAIAEQRFAQSTSAGCGCCQCGGQPQDQAQKNAMTTTAVRRTGLQGHVKSVRREVQAHLAALLSEHHRTRIEAGHPYVGWTFASVSAFDRKHLVSIISLLFQDIHIGAKATLKLPAAKKSLYARNITIHATGQLVTGAAYTKIWANSISRPGIDLVKFVPWLIANN